MKKHISTIVHGFIFLALSLPISAELRDKRLIGSWQGMREQSTECQFFAWKKKFTEDGKFEISFFADKDRLEFIQTERGTWEASNGRNTLKTKGVKTPEIYLYTVINNDTIKYKNIVKDPSADCQADYEFTEYRIKE